MIGQFMKKELLRVFTDKKLIFSLFILPVIILFCIFGFMSFAMSNMISDIEQHISIVYVQNSPKEFVDFSKQIDLSAFEITYLEKEEDINSIKQSVKDGEIDLLVVFEDEFMEKIRSYDTNKYIPQIKTFYNPSEDYSSEARSVYLDTVIYSFRNQLMVERFGDLNKISIFNIDTDNSESVQQYESKATGKFLGMLVPYMITILLFASVMSVAVDAIAGEKERGTMAAILLTPVDRKKIIIGKVLGLTILSIMSALIYGISTVVEMPMFIGNFGPSMSISLDYSVMQIAQMLIVIVIMAALDVTLVSVLSAICKNVKEASTYISPLYMLVMISGILTMFGSGETPFIRYFIPIYNCALALKGIFTMELTMAQFLATTISSLGIMGILIFVLAKIFNSEKVMLNA